MSKKEKINELKLLLKIEDNKLAEKYLIKANWNIEEAKKLYESENSIHSEKNNILDETQIDFNISEELNESNEVFTQKNKALYNDFIKFLEKLFNKKTVSNFKDFFSSSKKDGGLIIIFQEENIDDIRNTFIRAANNKDVNNIKNLTIFPILKESKVANEIIKVLKVKSFPLYMFCKYKNRETMAIPFSLEKKILMKDLINILKDISNSLDLSLSMSFDGEKSKLNISEDSQNTTINQILKTLNDSINTSISSINPNNISEDSQNITFYQIVRILNNSINTLYDANRNEPSNIYNDSNNNYNIDIDEFLNNDKPNKEQTQSKTMDTTKVNSSNSSNVSSFTIPANNSTSTLNVGGSTKINNLTLSKIDGDTNICKIKFIINENNNEFIIKEFIKTYKVSSLFDYVNNLGMDKNSKQNFFSFDLFHRKKKLSEVKNNTLMEEGLCPFSEVSIEYSNK